MKKSANKSIKLVIRRDTLRLLAGKELTGAVGGEPALGLSGDGGKQCPFALLPLDPPVPTE
jgi:hypothetical protein